MDSERELLKGNTPTLVLAVLRDAPLHGYGIAREIERRSGNALRFKEGTLYPALHALEREGLILGQWSKEHGGRERKVYTITPAGLGALERRTRTWTEFASAIYQVIGGETNAGTKRTPGGARPRKPIRPTADPEPIG
jgi:PadR family transcriptional regulator PadR